MSWHGESWGNKGGFPSLFSPDSDDQLSLNFHRFFFFYISCKTRSAFGQYCLPKVSNGFKDTHGHLSGFPIWIGWSIATRVWYLKRPNIKCCSITRYFTYVLIKVCIQVKLLPHARLWNMANTGRLHQQWALVALDAEHFILPFQSHTCLFNKGIKG